MPKYEVELTETVTYYFLVEAEDEGRAIQKVWDKIDDTPIIDACDDYESSGYQAHADTV